MHSPTGSSTVGGPAGGYDRAFFIATLVASVAAIGVLVFLPSRPTA